MILFIVNLKKQKKEKEKIESDHMMLIDKMHVLYIKAQSSFLYQNSILVSLKLRKGSDE